MIMFVILISTLWLIKLYRAITRSADTLIKWSGGPKFLVTSTSGGYEMVVDTFNKTCACNKWQLSGIPCFHVVACYHSRNIDPVQGIHPCYNRDMYLKVTLITAFYHFLDVIIPNGFFDMSSIFSRCMSTFYSQLTEQNFGSRHHIQNLCHQMSKLLQEDLKKDQEKMIFQQWILQS